MKIKERFKKSQWAIKLLVGGSVLLTYSLVAHGSVYNIYLNNTEQGANSQATPQLHYQASPSEPKPAPASAQSELNPVAPATPPAAGASTAAPAPVAAQTTITNEPAAPVLFRRPWRWVMSGLVGEHSQFGPGFGGLATLSYLPFDRLGISLFAGAAEMRKDSSYSEGKTYHSRTKIRYGSLIGVEAEFIPVKIGFIWWDDVFEVGLLGGFSTAVALKNYPGSLHAGARATINLGSKYGITASARANLGFVAVDAGFKFNL